MSVCVLIDSLQSAVIGDIVGSCACFKLSALILCDYRLRLQEGFHFIHTHHGILSLAIELDMQVVLLCAVQI